MRAASAAILLPAALVCLWAGGALWTVLVLIAGLLMMREWRAMARNWPYWASLPAGLLWILPAVLSLEWLRAREPGGMGNVLFLLCVVWASDIGAYMLGRLVGGPKLAPSISPGKTRSGAVGGLLAAIGVGAAAAALGDGVFATSMAIAAVLGVISQAGDLLESAAKRHFGVKDSGNLIPGHGGLLDRLDAVLTVAPAAAALVLWRGEVLRQ
ncbi:MAG: phosphatidate cytidylyltransferase [Alphaproteobacteria bacterium]|nr:phosphatidate cytidylyltransferase [Alphaproteobacteria bacterium]